MKRKLEKKPYEERVKTIFPWLFWTKCDFCKHEYKREKMWRVKAYKIGYISATGRYVEPLWCEKNVCCCCANDEEEAFKLVEEAEQRRNAPPSSPPQGQK